jgi:putative membrane protein
MTAVNKKYLFVHVDGLSYDVMQKTKLDGLLPNFSSFLTQNGYTVSSYFSELPSSTFYFQSKFFFGTNTDVLSFRWFDKSKKRIISAFVPESIKLLRKEVFKTIRPELKNAAVFEGIFSPGNKLISLTSEDLVIENNSSQTINNIKKDLSNFSNKLLLKTAFAFPIEALKEVVRWITVNSEDRSPFRRWFFQENLTLFGFKSTYYRSKLMELINKKEDSVYFNYTNYDHMSHNFGTFSGPALNSLRLFDTKFMPIIEKSVKNGYLPIIFSDHGQTDAWIFGRENASNLKTVFSKYSNVKENDITLSPGIGLLRRIEYEKTTARVFIACSGPVALVYFTYLPERQTDKNLGELFPNLVERLANTKGIGLVCLRSNGDEFRLYSHEGAGHFLENGSYSYSKVDPLEKYQATKEVRESLYKWLNFNNQADILLLGDYDGVKVCSFEDHIGTHGGIGGPQTNPFYCLPRDQDQIVKKFFK